MTNLGHAIGSLTGLFLPTEYYALICFFIIVPLVWVRRIEKFANFHILADIAILLTLVVVISFALMFLGEHGPAEGFVPINN